MPQCEPLIARWLVGESDGPSAGDDYQLEAAAVERYIASGAVQADRLPWSESLAIMHTLDEIEGDNMCAGRHHARPHSDSGPFR